MGAFELELVTLGADPEFFIVDKDGEIIPGRVFTEGTKENPEDMGGGYFLSWDNVTLEGNIPPATSKEEFIANMQTLKDIINMRVKPYGGRILYKNSMKIPNKLFKDPTYKVVGCDIDFCVHDPRVEDNFIPHSGQISLESLKTLKPSMIKRLSTLSKVMEQPTRFAGFHLHFGVGRACSNIGSDYGTTYLFEIIRYTDDKFLKFMGNYLNLDSDERYEVYGKGMFRPKQYGFEYRSLGSYFAQDRFLGEIYDVAKESIYGASHVKLNERKVKINA